MANRRGRKPAQPGRLNPRGALPEGNVPVARLTATADMIAAGGQAAAYAQTAKTLGGLGRKVGRMADTAAASEGTRAGLTGGLDPGYRPTGDTTIRGQAFERTATATYLDKLNSDLRQDIARVSELNKGNPKAMAGAFKALDTEYRANHVLGEFPEADAVYRRVFERQAQAAVSAAERTATAAANARARAARKAAFDDDLDQRLKDLQRNAFGLGLGDKADQLVGADLVDLKTQLDATDAAGKRLMPAGEAGRLFRKAEVGVARARVQSAFEALGTMEAKEAFVDVFEKDYVTGSGVLKVFDLSDFERARAAMRGQVKAEKTVRRSVLKEQVREIEAIAKDGLPVAPELLKKAREGALELGDGDLYTALGDAEALVSEQQELLKLSPSELDAQAKELAGRLNEKGATGSDAARLDLIETTRDTMMRATASDPLSYAARTGFFDVPPLELDGPGAVASLATRAGVARLVGDQYEVTPRFFTKAETGVLAQRLNQGTAEERLGMLAVVAEGLGRDAPAAFGELATEPAARAYAYAGGLLTLGGNRLATARDAIIGLEALERKEKAPGSDSEMRQEFIATAGLAIGEADLEARVAGFETARAIYTARALRQGLDAYDSDLFGEAVQEAFGAIQGPNGQVGGIGTRQGREVVLPATMTQNEFNDAIERLQADDLTALSLGGGAPVHGDGTAATVAELRGAYLVSRGLGRYRVSMTNPSTIPTFLVDPKAGAYYEIRINDPALATRGSDPVAEDRAKAPEELVVRGLAPFAAAIAKDRRQ